MKDEVDGDDFLRIITGNPLWCFSRQESDLKVDLIQFKTFEEMQVYAIGHTRRGGNVTRFLENSFGSPYQYMDFLGYYFGDGNSPALVMLCGMPDEVKTEGLDNVRVVQKTPQGNGKRGRVYCEIEVMNYLLYK